MRIREMLIDQDSPDSGSSDLEPEPLSYDSYIEQVLEASRQMTQNSRLRYKSWRGAHEGDSSVSITPRRIRAKLTNQAFLNYTQLSVDERHQLEAVSSMTMSRIDGDASPYDMQTMINYVPLLFHPQKVAIIGAREEHSSIITLESDKLQTPQQRHVLLGGLATVLYYSYLPRELLNTVE